jgi:hypothetical protein
MKGFPNSEPLHLKCISISGLPVDEIPCVEVWDTQGNIFNSHNGMVGNSNCTWSGEYGDGFFKIEKNLIGDFSIMCRFGGKHAVTRDKTTLIFKYQNSTGIRQIFDSIVKHSFSAIKFTCILFRSLLYCFNFTDIYIYTY